MKKLVSLLFHRVVLVAVFILIQIAVLLVMILRFNSYFVYFYWLCVAVSILAVLWILGNRSDPAYKIAWIVPILIVPIFGGLFYIMFGGNRLSSRTRRRMQGLERKMEEVLRPDFQADELLPIGEDAVHQARYLEHMAHCPVYGNTVTEYFSLGEFCFARMIEELKKAERYIFVEYFIVEEGEMWNAILDILKEKAAQGVDVRLLYDDIGSMFTLPRDYARDLEAKTGIKCCVFNPFVPILTIRLNNRDHRKIMVIDGKVGFTGGINLADEYINAKVKYGHWKDSAIMVRGDAAWSMAVMFLTLWDDVQETLTEDYDQFRPVWAPGEKPEGTQGFVQPYTDNPLDGEAVGQSVYLNLINKARKYVYITTPYLIVDNSMNNALCIAAKSGVDVRIMTPHIPDKRAVFELTRSHYEPLLEAGVKIYEYTPGFVHAKNFAVDDEYGTVGSINLDYRSLFLHFENGVWLCSDPSVLDIKADFLETLEQCQPVTLEQCRALPWWRTLFRSVLRMFAPLM